MTGCTGPEMALDGSGCLTARQPNSASGPMSYDVHGTPVQLPSSAWPYPCPIGAANGLAKDPDTGLWTVQTLLPTWSSYQVSPPGTTYRMAYDAWTGNTPVRTFVLANPLCTPLQAVVSATLRAALVLFDTQAVLMAAWLGQGAAPAPDVLPRYGTAHLNDAAPGTVPFALPVTLARRVSVPAGGTATLTLAQALYLNAVGPPTPPGSPTFVRPSYPGYVTAWSAEVFAQGWPCAAPVSDG